MFSVLGGSWALILGVFLLMIGNGLQGSLLGLRGESEGFTTLQLSLVMSGYYIGFLFASRLAPLLLQRVGHVRVFSALGSLISAILVLYPVIADPWVWFVLRVVIGFCFCGVYVTAESWLNDTATNENRGKALSLYMIAQMAGIVLAQYLLVLSDIGGFVIFIIPSVLVSLSFAPILLSSTAAQPKFENTKPLPLKRLIAASPLACVGVFLLGSVFSALMGMSAVYGARAGMNVAQISLMVSVAYTAPLLVQYPIGLLSDRMDRRVLIAALAGAGMVGAFLSFILPFSLPLVLTSAALIGGTANPLYALMIAHANDYLDRSDMAAASGGLLFINGLGAIAGPFVVGWMMDGVGSNGFWLMSTLLMAALLLYTLWRMRVGSDREIVGERGVFTPIAAQATPVAAGAAQEAAADDAMKKDEP